MNVKLLIAMLSVTTFSVLSACSGGDSKDHSAAEIKNPAAYITDEAKLKMLYSMTEIDVKSEGRIYELDYNVDYKLDEALKAQPISLDELAGFLAAHLFDKSPQKSAEIGSGAGCSAFAYPTHLRGIS